MEVATTRMPSRGVARNLAHGTVSDNFQRHPCCFEKDNSCCHVRDPYFIHMLPAFWQQFST